MKKMLVVLAMVFMLLPVTAMAGALCVWRLTGIVTYNESGTCYKGSSAIPLPKGDKGDTGIQGIQGPKGDPASTEMPEHDYAFMTSVNSGWVIAPMELIQDGAKFDLLVKPDGRPYTFYYYQWGWWRMYFYKVRCAIDPSVLLWEFPATMGGALVFPGLQMCP